jgi:hypothetical protein
MELVTDASAAATSLVSCLQSLANDSSALLPPPPPSRKSDGWAAAT